MKRVYRFVLIFLAALLGLVLFLVLQGDREDIQIMAVIPAEGEQSGIYGPIGIRFSKPMDQTSVESHFSLSPAVTGHFEWDENTLWFLPDTLLDPDQDYRLSLSAGAKSVHGQTLLDSQQWTISIRTPDVLYLVLGDHGGDLWIWDTVHQTSQSLTDTSGLLIDYAPDKTGERIVYAVENKEGGSDLRLVNRDGTEHALLFSCGPDYCSQSDWSPDGKWIAYSRQILDADQGLLQASRVWTLNVATKETTPLYKNESVLGQMPSFSPDGQ